MKKLITAALVTLAFAGTATADQVYVNNGVNYGGSSETVVNDTTTGWKDTLTFSYRSSSIVTDVDNSGGFSLGDTIVSSGGFFGKALGINAVTELLTAEQFGQGPSDNDYGDDWVLTFRFSDLMGTFNGSDFEYSSGSIDMLLIDSNYGASNAVHLFSLDIMSHSASSGNHLYTGDVNNFGTDIVNGVSVGDIFNIAYGNSALSFEDYADQTGNSVRFRLDQNTDGEATVVSYFGSEGCEATSSNQICLAAKHDGSLEFEVPEPASIAILGLGLLGFAGARRRKS